MLAFNLLPGEGDEPLQFECIACGDVMIVTDLGRHAREKHGLQGYTVDTTTANREL